jgi:hypothetical protein
MPQVSIQGSITGQGNEGPNIPLEVMVFEETRKAKLRTYQRAQAFSDTSLILGAYNREFTLNCAIPQDFARYEDIEDLLASLQWRDQILTDAEGATYHVRVSNVSDVHQGGQPEYYEVDITCVAVDNIKN